MAAKKFDLKEKIALATASKELSIGLQYILSALGYSYSAQKTNPEKRNHLFFPLCHILQQKNIILNQQKV